MRITAVNSALEYIREDQDGLAGLDMAFTTDDLIVLLDEGCMVTVHDMENDKHIEIRPPKSMFTYSVPVDELEDVLLAGMRAHQAEKDAKKPAIKAPR